MRATVRFPMHRSLANAWLLATLCTVMPVAMHAQTTPATPPATPRQGPAAQGAEPDVALLARFDRNNTKRLERAERDSARAYLAAHPELRPPMRGQKLPATGAPGPRILPRDVERYPATVGLYAPEALRTVFLTFEHADWERELADFWHTDVEV